MAPTRRPNVAGSPGRLAAVPRYDDGYDDHGAYGYDDRRAYGARPARTSAYAGRPGPVGYSLRSGRAEVRRRRLNVLVGLLAVAATTAIGGFALGISALVAVNLLVDAILVFYIYLLVQLRRAEEERAMRNIWSQAA